MAKTKNKETKIKKKPGRKPKRKVYFGIEVQEAIIKYNSNPEDYTLRNLFPLNNIVLNYH